MPVPEGVEVRFPLDGGCFGCSPNNPVGLQLTFRREGDTIHTRYRVPDRFHGAPAITHGGIVATILDEVSCAAIAFTIDRFVVTGELSVRYEHACPVEEPLDISARIVNREHPKYAVVEGEIHHAGTRVARSTGKFFYQDRPDVAP